VMPEWKPYGDKFSSLIFPEEKMDVGSGKN
jgi:hypothetical protein